MVAARSAAMAFNRLVDRDIDALMERTAGRPLVTGVIEPRNALVFAVILQIAILDIVFSLDSVITAVGMTDYLPVMVIAVVLAVVVMIVTVEQVSAYIERHPTVKILALSFFRSS